MHPVSFINPGRGGGEARVSHPVSGLGDQGAEAVLGGPEAELMGNTYAQESSWGGGDNGWGYGFVMRGKETGVEGRMSCRGRGSGKPKLRGGD